MYTASVKRIEEEDESTSVVPAGGSRNTTQPGVSVLLTPNAPVLVFCVMSK